MTPLAYVATGFALLRGLMLTVLTVAWIAKKMRSPDATEAERAALWMVGSRTMLLGIAILVLSMAKQPEVLAWVILGDGILQLFDTCLAVVQRKRALAILPAILCILDGCASVALMQ